MAIVDRTMVKVLSALAQLKYGEDGQGMAEYGLILALVAVVVVGAVTTLGTNINSKVTSIAGSI